MITQAEFESFKESIDSFISEYRNASVTKITDWPDYEKNYRLRVTRVATDLRSIIDASASKIRIDHFGRFPSLDLRERVFLLITKEIYRQSNRREAYLLPLMGLDKNIGYKTVERLYSDPLVIMVLHNIFLLSLQKRGIVEVDSCGDGTGYSLSMTKHYRSIREREGEGVKEGKFVYSFALMDLSSRMYVGYAVSIKSEKDAYHKALEMISDMRIDLRSVRLDKYYSGQSILDDFSENTRIFILPKSNSRIRGKKGWREIIRRFMEDPMTYLKEYFRRNASESGFSADKRFLGGIMTRRRADRIEVSGFCKGLIHNLMLMNG